MAKVHPSAIVDSLAELAEDVEVGPGCVIQGQVTIARGCRLIGQVYVVGPVRLGRANVLYPQVCIGFDPQHRDASPSGTGMVMGNDNILREGVTIHAATGEKPTTIGDRNYIMTHSHLGHDVQMANDCTLGPETLIGGHVEIQNRANFGGNAVVHQFCRVGRLAMISGLCGISHDLPPFCTCYINRRVGSLNLVGLRRAGFRGHIQSLKQAFDILYRQCHSNTQAVQLIQEQLGSDPLCRELGDFVRTTRRGICPYADAHGNPDVVPDQEEPVQ